MPTAAPKPEDRLIDLFLTVYDDCSWAGELSDRVRPERTADRGVEMLATRIKDGVTLALEHTLIEPFVGEKIDFHSHYQEFARRLKADPSLQAPGFSIQIDAPVHVLPHRTDWAGIVADVSEWIRATYLTFPQEKALRECPCPHHPDGKLTLQVMVTRLDDVSESFLIVQRFGPLHVDDSVEKALRTKLRKLVDTNADRLVLILERDQGAVLPNEIYQHVDRMRPQFPELAEIDEIWIADTATMFPEKSYLCFLNREGGATEESFQFNRGVLQAIARKGQTVYTVSQGWWFQPSRPHPLGCF